MDIYAAIKDKEIVREISDGFDKKNYKYTKLDKKVLALFMAGMLVKGNINDIFSQYDDIKLSEFLDFLNIKENDIVPLKDEEYEDFYNKNIKLELASITKEANTISTINVLTPEVIVSSLQFISLHGSKILDSFGYEHKNTLSGGHFFSDHPIFKTLKNYIIDNKNITTEAPNKPKPILPDLDDILLVDILTPFGKSKKTKAKELELETNDKPKKPQSIINEHTWEILEEIKKKFIGQEKAAEDLFYNIINNQHLAEQENIPDGQRAIIFMDGPSGTGKTAIAREITDKIGIPFVRTTVTDYSSTGYVGGDLTDLLKELYKKANGDLELAQRGIIVLDEFDKLAYSDSHELTMSKAVQRQLLDFMGGGKYNIHVGHGFFGGEEVEFDTSKITFIGLGALTDLRAEKTAVKKSLGFGEVRISPEKRDYTITPQDLIKIGLEKELAGRFNTFLHTDDYSIEALERILRESSISPMIGFRTWIETWKKELVVDDQIYRLIAELAYALNTGARSLQTIMNGIRTPFIKDVLRGTDKEIYLSPEIITNITNQTMTRKVRG